MACISMQPKKHKFAAAKIPEKSAFHGKHEIDPITKRSWIEPPKEKRKENEYCYLPKKHIHTWSGHTKGVNAIRQATSASVPMRTEIPALCPCSREESRLSSSHHASWNHCSQEQQHGPSLLLPSPKAFTTSAGPLWHFGRL